LCLLHIPARADIDLVLPGMVTTVTKFNAAKMGSYHFIVQYFVIEFFSNVITLHAFFANCWVQCTPMMGMGQD